MRSVNRFGGGVLLLASVMLLFGPAAAETRAPARKALSHEAAKKARKAPEPIKPLEEARPAGDGDFTYALKNVVKAKSSEFCNRYSGASDCIQDIEICLTMLDLDDDTVRVCMTVSPSDPDKARTASALR